MPLLSIEIRNLDPQPILFIRRELPRSEIAKALGECYGKLARHCQMNGVSAAGPPFLRTLAMHGSERMEIAAGFPVAAASSGEGEIESCELPGGRAAVAVLAGPYEQVPEAYTEVMRWLEARDLRPGDAPWESYVTDPMAVPDQRDWCTEIYVPIAE